MRTFKKEIRQGERFRFGRNWRSFLSALNRERLSAAEESLKKMLGYQQLKGKKFLDIGSGSGLFSLAARRLGAQVHSFDYDPDSVLCTKELKSRFFPEDPSWTIEEGSVLDKAYLKSLGEFDIVYSWGVLHHTGDMFGAMENATGTVAPGGLLYVAIYNDQGPLSRFWRTVKKNYCAGRLRKILITASFFPLFFLQSLTIGLLRYRHPIGHIRNYKDKRGMSIIHDWRDWLGGYPFEVAKPEKIFDFCKQRGFNLISMKTVNSLGNNEFLFEKVLHKKSE